MVSKIEMLCKAGGMDRVWKEVNERLGEKIEMLCREGSTGGGRRSG